MMSFIDPIKYYFSQQLIMNKSYNLGDAVLPIFIS